MADEKEVENVLDDRFSLRDNDGILSSLQLVAEKTYSREISKDQADILIKILGAARLTLAEKRKQGKTMNSAAKQAVEAPRLTASGPFAVYSSGK
tara:strand:+ start:185 stop:469 length:285 start_codon:yes stop_codon:yes gene_type:complete